VPLRETTKISVSIVLLPEFEVSTSALRIKIIWSRYAVAFAILHTLFSLE